MAEPHDLLIKNAACIATVDAARTEVMGGWIAIDGSIIAALGTAGSEPTATNVIDASDCLVTPGLINTHHHLYQNLTRAYPAMTAAPLFGWLQSLYPLWTRLDEEAAHVSAWVGLAELALSGCTTSTDHLYVHPAGAGDLITAEIDAAIDLGMRFHPTHGSMSLSVKDGGLPPDSVVMDEDTILAESERLVARHHDRSADSMVRIALAPCSPFSVTPQLMTQTAELAERLDVRLHTHLAENTEDDEFSLATFGKTCVEQFESVGWATDRSWVAHCVRPSPSETSRLGRAGVGVAHCPSSNMILSSGIAPVVALREAGSPVGLGCDGSSSADSASLWMEARNALLVAKLTTGADSITARDVLEMATLEGARCLGREGDVGQLAVGMQADIAIWNLTGPLFAGVVHDPIEGWLRCGPTAPTHTIVAGQPIVADGELVSPKVDEMLRSHRQIAERFQT